ncbi:MAG: sulfatase-like hydrolase/transferase [Clostridia bacterium]
MNILFIFSDQQHKYALGKINKQFITPNLDILSNEGVLFKNAYSNNPVCGPYRGCLFTGQYTSRCKVYENGFALPQGTQTMQEALQQQGYSTSYVGKWHLGGNGQGVINSTLRLGFDKFIGYQCYNGFDPNPPFNNEIVFADQDDNLYTYNKHRTDVTTELAINALDAITKSDKNFFLCVSYQAPHYPEQPLEKFADLYKNVTFDLPKDYEEIDPYTPTFSPRSPRPFDSCPDYMRYGNNIQEYMRLYAALCSQVDDGVGQILNKLKELDLYEDTIIVYTADHGDMQGCKGLKNKCYAYEKSAGVPMIIRYPGGRKNTVTDELISSVDFFPTFIDIANANTTTKLDGVSLISYLTSKTESTQKYVISEYLHNNPWRMIRDKNYKLVTDANYHPTMLYDMITDELEAINLINDKKYTDIILNLNTILKNKTLVCDKFK